MTKSKWDEICNYIQTLYETLDERMDAEELARLTIDAAKEELRAEMSSKTEGERFLEKYELLQKFLPPMDMTDANVDPVDSLGSYFATMTPEDREAAGLPPRQKATGG